jgi:hypothetical protein
MKRLVGLFEIFLLIMGSVAFAYIIGQTNPLIQSLPIESKEEKFVAFLREKALDYLSRGLVSAQSSSVQTCLVDIRNSSCQEYPSEVCNSQCATQGGCFPGRRADFAPCQLGTCYNTNGGICSYGSPKAACENGGGTWHENPPAQCNRGCCLINPDGSGGAAQAQLTTNQQCTRLGQTLGAQVAWESQTLGELQCLAKVRTQKEGACVLEFVAEEQKYNCQFTTEARCLTSGGQFYAGALCTNPSLNTKCVRTSNTQCFDGKDGVYFIDSCGNRANIYDSAKTQTDDYWNMVIPLDSTSLCKINKDSSGKIINEARCGNCDYLAGSICGAPRAGDDSPDNGQYICRDLSCVDEKAIDPNKRIRKHGESWCAFEGWIGTDGQNGTNEERAVDVPGSRHYRKLCYEGEIRLEPCAEYRNGVCVENDVSEDFTTAQCRTNTGALCTSYNEDADKLAKCEESPDCFLKHVEIDKFKFDFCSPKYPPGFELEENQADSAAICSFGTRTCTYYEKKNIEGRWECKINCGCKEAEFAQTMNNLCISLGDCGSHVNLARGLGDGYSTSGDRQPEISEEYIGLSDNQGLKKYATPKAGQRVDGFTNEQIAALTGINFSFNDPNKLGEQIAQYGAGAAVALNIYAISQGSSASVGLVGFTNALTVVAAGASIGYIIGLALGLEGDELNTAVSIGAGVAVAVIATASIIEGGLGAGIAALASSVVLAWIAVIAIITALVLSLAGVGEYREKKVEFKCLPWQPPSGGDNCSKCSELGEECTAYKCASLGQTCQLLNPETADEVCANINPNDVAAPVISFNATSLPSGYTFVESNNGVEIRSNSSDFSIQEYTAVTFGVTTSEPAQCKISAARPQNGYDDMPEEYFDSSQNAYVTTHLDNRAMETLDNLGVAGPSADLSRRGDYNLYVLCQDKSGNGNEVGYNIRFRVSPANDLTPPVIRKYVPESPGVTGINSTTFTLAFYTNEPATCRFSTIDQAYETMEGEAVCNNNLVQSTLDGWLCRAVLNVTAETNEYYFRCADKPWIGDNVAQSGITLGSGRNANTQSMPEGGPYTVRRTTTPLTITSASPNNRTISSATEPVAVTLDVVTAGGIESGKAFCKYSFDGNRYTDFAITSLNNHKQIFTSLFRGDYNIRLNCTDRAGNSAESSAQFKIEVDNLGPLITRVYNSGASLTVVTNEESSCRYSLDSCSFEFEAGTALSGASKVHTMPYSNGKTYRIKCKDTFGNLGTCLSVSGGY